jgi:hypothetical protein
LDLNGQVAVRAKGADSPRPTEVVLTGSTSSEETIRVNVSRDFLGRTLRLGFRELSISGENTALACIDAERHYIFMPLNPEGAIPPAKNAIRIVSGQAQPDVPISTPPSQRSKSTVSKTTTTTNGNGQPQAASQPPATEPAAKTNGQARRAPRNTNREDIAGLIAQVEALRQSQREVLMKTNDLLKGLKRHRRTTRNIENTLASLRQLKTLGV